MNNSLRVLVTGSINTGKSTLINAFLAEELRPVSVFPDIESAGVTEIKYSEEKKAVLNFCEFRQERYSVVLSPKAAKYIKKFSKNEIPPLEIPYDEIGDYRMIPIQKKNLWASRRLCEKSEIFYPNLFLKNGIELVDMLGFQIYGMESEIRNYLISGNIDIVLFVLDAASFWRTDEKRYFETIKNFLENPKNQIFFVVNRFDCINESQKAYIQKHINRTLKNYTANPVFYISARNALLGKQAGETESRNGFEMRKLEKKLLELAAEKTKKAEELRKEKETKETEEIYRDEEIEKTKASDNQAQRQEFFSWKNFNELTDFNNHLMFAEEMIRRYHWDASAEKKLAAQLEKIKAKQRDKKLNLSVVGDFTTGKSSFINALLRSELLVSSAVQGTTVASTIIEYSKEYGIKLQYHDGWTEAFQFRGISELKENLGKYTTNPELAKKLEYVYVYLPSESLKSGIRIIDTPGTNAIEQWHEEVTIHTLNETSDLSIVLIDANKVLPDSFQHFLENNLSSVLPQCIFVVTKLDLVKKRERARVLAYTEKKLEQSFGLKQPFVLPYISTEIIKDFTQNLSEEINDEFLQMSYENESKIFLYMPKQKGIAQGKKLIALMEAIYLLISEQMSEIENGYKDELNLLLRTQNTDLGSFISEQKGKRRDSYNRTVKENHQEIVNYFYTLSASAQKNIMEELDKKSTLEEIKSYVEQKLQKDCEKEAQWLFEEAEKRYACVRDWLQDEIAEFLIEFEELYKDLDILEIDLSHEKISVPAAKKIQADDLSAAAKYIAEEVSKENKAIFGGAAAGAAVGTAIAPGLGTILGGVIGFIGGAVFAPEVSEVKKRIKEKLQNPLYQYFNNLVYHSTTAFDKYIDEVRGCISREIDKYLTDYNEIVKKRIAEEENKRSSIEMQLKKLRTDMEKIEQRKFKLDSMNEQLDKIGRKDW